MIRADCHLHTTFSPDGGQTPAALASRAKELGLNYIAVTDHTDIGYPDPAVVGLTDYGRYLATLASLKETCADALYLAPGIEVGFTEGGAAETARILEGQPFEYVLNSVHEIGGLDCYFPAYYKGRTQDEAYLVYLRAVLKSLSASYRYDAVGHLGYVCRKAPYDDPALLRPATADLLDEILTGVVAREKILELNTSTAGRAPCFPEPAVLARYRALGGRLITFSSDAHMSEHVARGFAAAAQAAKTAGFTEYYVRQNGKLAACPID